MSLCSRDQKLFKSAIKGALKQATQSPVSKEPNHQNEASSMTQSDPNNPEITTILTETKARVIPEQVIAVQETAEHQLQLSARELEELRASNALMESQIESLTAKNAELSEKVSDQRDTIRELEQKCEKQASRESALQASFDKVERDKITLEGLLLDAQEEKVALEVDLRSAKNQLGEKRFRTTTGPS